MLNKLFALIVVGFCIVRQTNAAGLRTQDAAIFVKDSNSGQLRFMGNSPINQFITNKQDFLEQLRPDGNWNNGGSVGGSGFITTTTGTGGTVTNNPTGTNIGTNTNVATGTGISMAPITTGTRGTIIRPLVISSNNRRLVNRRPGINNRRGNRRRRGNRTPQVIVIRPRQ